MADWPENIADGQLTATYGSTILTDSTAFNNNPAIGLRGVQLTPGTPANTKGSWTTIISSVPWDAAGFLLSIAYANPLAYFIDIAVGNPPSGYPDTGTGTAALPFSATSIWNTPLGAGNEANWVDCQLSTHPPANPNIHADEDIVIMSPGSPATPVWTNNVGWSGLAQSDPHARERTDAGVAGASAGFSLPWPNNFILPGGEFVGDTPNWGSAILDGSNVVHQIQPVTHGATSGSPPSSSPTNTITAFDVSPPSYNLTTGDGRLGAHGGSGLSSLGGCIRIGELTTANTGGYIKHALKIELDADAQQLSLTSGPGGGAGYRWPAVQSDTVGAGAVPAMMEGSLCALKQSFNVAALNTEPGRIIARTLKNYGAYVVDSTSGNGYALVAEHSNVGRVGGAVYGTNPGISNEFNANWGFNFGTSNMGSGWGQDINTIFNNLWVVNNNFDGSTGTIGGPGTRIVSPVSAGDTRIVSDFGVMNDAVGQSGYNQYFPIGLRAGDMVSGRCQRSDNVQLPVDVMIIPISGDPSTSCGRMRTYGRQTTTDTVNVTPYGGAENPTNLGGTKGPWVLLQVYINGSLSNPVQQDISQVIVHFSTRQFTAQNTQRWYVDIGIGPNSSSVTTLIPNLIVETNTTSAQYGTVYLGPLPCSIPAGTFIWARSAMNISGVVTGPVGVGLLVYGFS